MVHQDVLRIDEQAERDRFVDKIVELAPAAAALQEELGRNLLEMAAGTLTKRGSDGDKTTDVLAVVRPACSMLFVADDPQRTPYVDIKVGDHRETHPIEGESFRGHVRSLYYRARSRALAEAVARDVQATLAAEARESGKKCRVCVRVATHGRTVLLDLCNERWEVVEVDAEGFRVLAAAPDDIRFKRSPSMNALPTPADESGASIDLLRGFLRCRTENDFVVTVSWLVASLRGRKPLPIMVLSGEQGSGKSSHCRALQELVDPSSLGLDSLPRDERNLMIAAKSTWLLAYDNVSTLPDWLSDAMCRISTGAGWRTRKNYADEEFVAFSGVRPQLLNGIPDFVSRPDFADRAIVIKLAPFEPGARVSEDEFWREFNAAKPQILAALLVGVSTALAREGEIELPDRPRMADFTEVATAAEVAFGWEEGTFLKAYQANQRDSVEALLAVDPVAEAVRKLVGDRGRWEGTATELLREIECLGLPKSLLLSKQWPRTAEALGGHLRRIKPSLEQSGIKLEAGRSAHKRVIRITGTDQPDQKTLDDLQ
ncbi:MAG TPA: hypothetical protein VFZ65_04710 [Planctomycetota bacterium]|nr:hypothetical protein [Planctomycetota bacterium]